MAAAPATAAPEVRAVAGMAVDTTPAALIRQATARAASVGAETVLAMAGPGMAVQIAPPVLMRPATAAIMAPAMVAPAVPVVRAVTEMAAEMGPAAVILPQTVLITVAPGMPAQVQRAAKVAETARMMAETATAAAMAQAIPAVTAAMLRPPPKMTAIRIRNPRRLRAVQMDNARCQNAPGIPKNGMQRPISSGWRASHGARRNYATPAAVTVREAKSARPRLVNFSTAELEL